tara:strand:+ start:4098 stop:4775 length:678 start_codon:yes stop_codon:yes gene_type:complete
MTNFVNTAVNTSSLSTFTLSSSTLNNECLGVVLAGGLSSRMGRDKAQLLRGKKSLLSMLEFSKQTLIDSGIKNIVVSGDNYDVPDKVKLSGPVGGILSVLAKYPYAKSLLILPVDLPFMTAKALADLRLKGELSQKATYFEGHNIPLYLPNNSYVELFLAQAFTKTSNNIGERSGLGTERQKKGPSIKALLKQIPHQAIQSSDVNILFNTNTPEQWQQAKQQFSF